MKKQTSILLIKKISDRGSKDVFLNPKKKITILPIETIGDAGSKGCFQIEKK